MPGIDEKPNQFRYRVKDPSLFDSNSFRTKELGQGISAIFGKLKNSDSMTLQAYRFDKSSWDKGKIQNWLKDHKENIGKETVGTEELTIVICLEDEEKEDEILECEDPTQQLIENDLGIEKTCSEIALEASTVGLEKIKRVIPFHQFEIGLETEPNEKRFVGSEYERVWTTGYGHLRNLVGSDKMALDCYIGDNLNSPLIFKLTQLTSDGSKFDEYKFMIGYNSIEQAKQAYLDNMPIDMFGGIQQVYIEHLLSYKKAIKDASKVGVESLTNPNEKWFEIPITTLPDGTKVLRSMNGKDWELNSIEAGLEVANKRYKEKIQTLMFESHPKIFKDEEGNEEPSQSSNPPLLEQNYGFVDHNKNKVLIRGELVGTERAQQYKEAFDLGYEPNISIRAARTCPLNAKTIDGKPLCYVTEGEYVTLDILQPHEYPGIPGSKLAVAFENLQKFTPQIIESKEHKDNCRCNNTCNKCISNNLLNQNIKTLSKKIGVEKLMDEKTLQMFVSQAVNLAQSLEDFVATLQENGMEAADIGNASMAYAAAKKKNGGDAAKPAPPMPPAPKPKEEEMGMMSLPGFESLVGLPVEDRKEIVSDLVSQQARKKSQTILEQSIAKARSTKAKWPLPEDSRLFGFESSHDLSNTSLYPVVEVSKKVLEVLSKHNDLRSIGAVLDEKLSTVATESLKSEEQKRKDAEESAKKAEEERKIGLESQDPLRPPLKPVVPQKTTDAPVDPKLVGQEKVNGEQRAVYKTYGFESVYQVSQSKRWRESVMKLANKVLERSKLPNAFIERNKFTSQYAMEQFFNICEKEFDINRLNAIHDLNEKHTPGRKFGLESLSVQGLGTDFLNREYISAAIRLIAFWTSPVWGLVSSSVAEQMRLGSVLNINEVPFAQFLDIKSRTYNQREVFDPRYRTLPNEPMHTVSSSDRWDSYAAYYTNSATYTTNPLEMFMKAAPLFENVPDDKLMILAKEDNLNYSQQIGTEIMLSWMRDHTYTVLNETVADSDYVRKFESGGSPTLAGVRLGSNVLAAILPIKGAAGASTAKRGPIVITEAVAVNTKGVESIDVRHDVVVSINGTELRPGKFNLLGEIIPLSNLPQHQNPQFAVHPSGLIGLAVASGVVASDFTSGYVVLEEYTYTTNYIELDFSNPNSLPNKEYANELHQKIDSTISKVHTDDYAPKPDAVWLPDNLVTYLGYADTVDGSLTTVSYATVTQNYTTGRDFDSIHYRGQKYIGSNDPVVRQYLGAAIVKGSVVAMEMGAPTFKTDIPVYVNDANGQSQITGQTAAYMQSCRFVNTIYTVNSAGAYVNQSNFGLFVMNQPAVVDTDFRT